MHNHSSLAADSSNPLALRAPVGPRCALFAGEGAISAPTGHGLLLVSIAARLTIEHQGSLITLQAGETYFAEDGARAFASGLTQQHWLALALLQSQWNRLLAARGGQWTAGRTLYPMTLAASPELMRAAMRLAERGAVVDSADIDRDWEWLALLRCLLDVQSPLQEYERRCPGRTQRLRQAALRRMLRARIRIDHERPGSLTVAQLAQLAHYTPSHFSRIFELVFGTPPQQLLLEQRMRHARALLCSRRYAVQEVAELVGFRSASAFARAFKTEFGQSPRESLV